MTTAACLTSSNLHGAAKPVPISTEPIINWFHRWIVEFLFAACVLGLVWMSLVPFEFHRSSGPFTDQHHIWGLTLTVFTIKDTLANICYYVPLGLCSCMVLRRWRFGWVLSAVLAIIPGSLTSFLIECTQRFIEGRVASWADVTANTLGTMVGAGIAVLWNQSIRRTIDQTRRLAAREWLNVVSKVVVCLVLVVQLRPYDVVIDLFHTAAGLRHADVRPLARWNQLPAKTAMLVARQRVPRGADALARARWEYGLDRLTDVATYGAVAALTALAMLARVTSHQSARRRRLASDTAPVDWGQCGRVENSSNAQFLRIFFASGLVTVSLAAMVTGIRVFLMTYGLDTAHFFCGIFGWLAGFAVSLLLWRQSPRDPNRAGPCQPGPSAADPCPPDASATNPCRPGAFLRVTAILTAVAIISANELVPFNFGSSTPARSFAAGRVIIEPFLSHYHSWPNVAVYNITGDLLRYAALAACMAVILQRFLEASWRTHVALTILSTVSICAGFQATHLFMAGRHCDVTTVLLAAIAAAAAAVAERWIRDYHASLTTVHADDLLTTRLIEGESYRPMLIPEVARPIPGQAPIVVGHSHSVSEKRRN